MTHDPELYRSLAAEHGTPYYLFDEETIRRRCRDLKAALPYENTAIRYACKALTLQAVLRIVREEGLWIDASSLNEVKRARLAGFTPHEIGYTGESASTHVFEELLEIGVEMNCSSLDQLCLIGRLRPGTSVAFRLNPGEGHGSHHKVNTGGPTSKHGIYIDQLDTVREIAREHGLKINGVHAHIGSGTDLAHWLRIKDITLDVARTFEGLDFINLGGGLPIVYNPETDAAMPLHEWGEQLTTSFAQFSKEYGKNIQLQIEPGRFVVAECGVLVAEVQNIKRTPEYTFVLVNTGFNHNPRPAMYGSYHPITFISGDGRAQSGSHEYVVAGYLCESGDVFTVTEDGELAPRQFSEVLLGDLMVMGHIGAYSHAMKSEYNSMALPPSLMKMSDGSVMLIERRGTLEDVMGREVLNSY